MQFEQLNKAAKSSKLGMGNEHHLSIRVYERGTFSVKNGIY